MEKTIEVDPITQNELLTAAKKGFLGVLNIMESEEMELSMTDWRDIAWTAYFNGFVHGCIGATTDEGLKETVFVMNEEIKIQKH